MFKKPGFHVGKIPDNWGFHCFQTIPDFADLLKHEILDIPDDLGWSGTNQDASQISAMICNFPSVGWSRISKIPDHLGLLQHMKTRLYVGPVWT